MWDAPNLLAQAHTARLAGADIVVVQVHGSEEYQARPTAERQALAAALTASDDVDLVFGEHVHVVQPVTKVNGTRVVYGMGNLVAQQVTRQPRTYEGMTMRFTFTGTLGGRYAVTKAGYIGTLNHLLRPDPRLLRALVARVRRRTHGPLPDSAHRHRLLREPPGSGARPRRGVTDRDRA